MSHGYGFPYGLVSVTTGCLGGHAPHASWLLQVRAVCSLIDAIWDVLPSSDPGEHPRRHGEYVQRCLAGQAVFRSRVI